MKRARWSNIKQNLSSVRKKYGKIKDFWSVGWVVNRHAQRWSGEEKKTDTKTLSLEWRIYA